MTKYIVQDMQLTSIANAIREKGGLSSSLLFPDDFIDAIENISGSTPEPTPLVEKDVNFYDYDGTLVYSYTSTEFLALSVMPESPDHSNDEIPLTSQGWNWTLSDAQEYITSYKQNQLNIGQVYIPTDGKTYIQIFIPEGIPSRYNFSLYFAQSAADAVIVDWGDNSPSETYGETNITLHTHTYNNSGKYIITLTVLLGETLTFGRGSYADHLCGASGTDKYLKDYIIQVFFGLRISISKSTFEQSDNLKNVVIPNNMTTIPQSLFSDCHNLTHLIIPPSVTFINSTMCYGCINLNMVALPREITGIGDYVFTQCYSLKKIILPDKIVSLGDDTFSSCKNLIYLTIPASVTSMGSGVFNNCESMYEYYFKSINPPTVDTSFDSSFFYNKSSDCVIYVPLSSINNYKSASGWQNYKDYIQSF